MLRNGGHAVAVPIIVQRLIVSDAVARGKGANEIEPDGESADEFKDLFDWLKRELS